jgi:OFA family oxalate/formate antiporter-like MFS transporter
MLGLAADTRHCEERRDEAIQSGGDLSDTGLLRSARNDAEKRNYTLAEAMKTAPFWFFLTWVVCIIVAGLLVINSAAPITVYFGAPAVVGLIVSVFNGAGRPVSGMVYDRFGRIPTMAITTAALLGGGVALLLGSIFSSIVLIIVGLPLIGISYGMAPAITSSFVYDYFGGKHFPRLYPALNCALIPAAIIGPLVSSALQEAAGGSYTTTFMMIIIATAVSLVLFALLNRAVKNR